MIVYSLFFSIPKFAIFVILLCFIIMAVVAWMDDFKDLSVRIRFGIQFIVVLISCLYLPRIWPILPIVLEKTIK